MSSLVQRILRYTQYCVPKVNLTVSPLFQKFFHHCLFVIPPQKDALPKSMYIRQFLVINSEILMSFLKINLNIMRQFYLRTTPSRMKESIAFTVYQILNRPFRRFLCIRAKLIRLYFHFCTRLFCRSRWCCS